MHPSTVLLGAGYALAVPFTVFVPGFLRMWRRREPALFIAEELGVSLIIAGWALHGRRAGVVTNSVWGGGLAIAYAAEGVKRRRRGAS